MLYCCCFITAQTESNYRKTNKDLICSDKWLICWIQINCEVPLQSQARLCLLELFGDLIPVVIVILISLWDAAKYLFYQHIHCWLPHKSLNDSCDKILAGWQWLCSIPVDKKNNLRNSLSCQREAEQLWTCSFVCSLIDIYGRIVQLQSIRLWLLLMHINSCLAACLLDSVVTQAVSCFHILQSDCCLVRARYRKWHLY